MIRRMLTVLFITLPLYGFVEHEINEETPLHVSFSANYLNRIKLEGSHIHEIRFSEDLQVSKDEKTGQAFVSLGNPQAMYKTQQITLTSSTGKIQDLLIHFQNQERELLLLKDLTETAPELKRENRPLSILASLRENKTPENFQERGLHKGEGKALRKGYLRIKLVKAFEAPGQSLQIFEVKNTAKQTSFLSEKDFVQEETAWIYLEKSILAAEEKTQLITLSGEASR